MGHATKQVPGNKGGEFKGIQGVLVEVARHIELIYDVMEIFATQQNNFEVYIGNDILGILGLTSLLTFSGNVLNGH